MARDPQTVEILDDDGQPHRYVIIPHGGRAGWQLKRRMMPLLVLLEGAEGGVGAIKGIAHTIAETADEALLMSLLTHTTRDGAKLSEGMHFDAAFQANYGELYVALYNVLKANFGGIFKRGGQGGNGLAGIAERLTVLTSALSSLQQSSGASTGPSSS